MLGVATGGGGVAAVGVGAADEFDLGHDAGAGSGGGFEEEPGNGGRVGGWIFGDDLAFDGAAVLRFPGGASSVGGYGFAGCVGESGFGG